jgi:hypothetical protein
MNFGHPMTAHYAAAMQPCMKSMAVSVVGAGSIRRLWRDALVTVKVAKLGRKPWEVV